jgi:hypothetical protein
MEFLGDMGLVENCFGPLRDGVNVGVIKEHGLSKMYRRP